MIAQGKKMPCEMRQHDSKKLELQAVALYRKNKMLLMMAPEVKNFLSAIADFNQWENLKREL